jgi:transposase
VVDKGEYGPGFIAHVVASKCADAMPLHRLAQRVERGGVPMSRSTLTDLFHRAAEVVAPLAARLLLVISQAAVVWADETPLRVLEVKKTHLGFLWTFLTQNAQGQWLIGYRFSMSRSGKTPQQVLEGTLGALVVDAYTGYNPVTLPGGRVRVGCWAHVRRKFFEALSTAPEAQQALDFILSLYRVEHEVVQQGVVRMLAHRALRQHKSRPVLESLHAWLTTQLPLHLPKGAMGEVLSYTLNQWKALGCFVDDQQLPLDNNRSEGAIRKVALGRQNFLFVGHQAAGENLAGLYALVATCEANGINPEQYLADVLLRVQTHPNSRMLGQRVLELTHRLTLEFTDKPCGGSTSRLRTRHHTMNTLPRLSWQTALLHCMPLWVTLSLMTSACGGADCELGMEKHRTELYMGLDRFEPHPDVTPGEFEDFVKATVSPLFPDGLTVLDAEGRYRAIDGSLVEESSKVIVLLHNGTSEESKKIETIREAYKAQFGQEAVMRLDSVSCMDLGSTKAP